MRDSVEPTDKVSLIDERLAIRPKKDSEFYKYVKSRELKMTARLLENIKHRIDDSLLHEDLKNERKTHLQEKVRKMLRHPHEQTKTRPRKRTACDERV